MIGKQYVTTDNQAFTEYELKPALKMDGVITAETEGAISNSDFLGFGVAITGASCYNLSKLTKEERTAVFKDLYTESGLNLSVARISIASSDYSAELYSYDDVEYDTELKHFSIDRDKEYIIPIIKEILEIKPDLYIYASPWSPPGWMKTGGSMCGGYMREEFLDCYADYFVKFIKAYENEGITVRAVTVQNETETHQAGKMPACMWHPDIEARFIIKLRKAFDTAEINTKILMLDHNFSAVNRATWQLETHSELKDSLDGIAFHYYDGGIEQTDILKEKHPKLELHFTEGGPRLYDNYAIDWCKWSIMISKVLNHGYRSFTGWNLMLDETGGPNIGPFFCGGLITRDRVDKTLKYSGQYKAFKHFTNLINPNTKIFDLKFANNQPCIFNYPNLGQQLEGTLFEDDKKAVLALVNPNKTKRQVQYCYGNEWWYIELLPNSVSTVVFEK